MSEGRRTNWLLWLGLAGAAGAAFFLSKKAQAAQGLDPNTPPPSSDPNRTRLQLLDAWKTWIPAYLGTYGWQLLPSYNGTTFQIADATTGDFSKLVQRNQAVTDNHLGFWWKVSEVNADPNKINDDAFWATLQQSYAKLVQDLTPAFLSK